MEGAAFRILIVTSLVVLAWRTALLGIGFMGSLRYLRTLDPLARLREETTFVVVVPLFQEQDHCRQTLEHIARVWGADRRLECVICATTTREAHVRTAALAQANTLAIDLAAGMPLASLVARYGNSFSVAELSDLATSSTSSRQDEIVDTIRLVLSARKLTSEVLAGEISAWNNRFGRELFVITEDDDPQGNRATQVNWAVSAWLAGRTAQPKSEIYIGMFDADSRPAESTLDEVAFAAQQGALAMQQPTIYLKDLRRLPAGLEGATMTVDALMQTVWSFGFELPNWRTAWQRVRDRSFSLFRRSSYGTGHGTWLRADVWIQLRGLRADVPASGMYLGYELSARNLAFFPLRSPDCAEVPIYTRQLIAQHKYWFAGGMQVFRLFRGSEVPGLSRPMAIGIVTREALVQIRWLFGPLSVAASMVACFAMGDYLLLAGLVSAVTAHCHLLPYMCFRNLQQLGSMIDHPIVIPRYSCAALLAAGPIRGIVRGVGPMLWAVEWIRRTLMNAPIVFQRTAR